MQLFVSELSHIIPHIKYLTDFHLIKAKTRRQTILYCNIVIYAAKSCIVSSSVYNAAESATGVDAR